MTRLILGELRHEKSDIRRFNRMLDMLESLRHHQDVFFGRVFVGHVSIRYVSR